MIKIADRQILIFFLIFLKKTWVRRIHNLVPPIYCKSEYRGPGPLKRPIHTTFHVYACLLLLSCLDPDRDIVHLYACIHA